MLFVKKLTISVLAVLLLCLTSCGMDVHTHSESAWRYNENGHWKMVECDRNDCAIADEVYDFDVHSDDDQDMICDICEYLLKKDVVFILTEDDTITEAVFEKKQ